MLGLRARASTAALWSGVEIGSRYGVQFFVTIVLARLLTPADFGILAILLIFITFAFVFVDSGFSSALIQKNEISADDEVSAFIMTLALGCVAALLLSISAAPLASFYHQPDLVPLTRVMSAILPCGAVGTVPDALLTRRLDFRSRAKAQAFASLGSGVLAIFLSWKGLGVWSLVWQALTATSLRSGLLWVYSGWGPRGLPTRASLRNLFRFGSYMLGAGILGVISSRIQSALLGRLFAPTVVGYYSLAENAQQVPTSFIGSLLARVGLPVFATIADDSARLRNALRASLQESLFIFIPCMLGLSLTARPLIATIYGERWLPAAPILSLLALSGILYPLHVLNLAALNAQGRSDRFFILEVWKNLATVAFVLIASPFGPIAVAWATLLAGLVSAIINTWYSRRMLRYGFLSQMIDQRATLLLSFFAAVPAWAILHWTPMSAVSTMGAVGAAVVIYLALARITRHPSLAHLQSYARSFFATQK